MIVLHVLTNWLGLVVGLVCLLESLLLYVLRRRQPSDRRRRPGLAMIVCLGVMLTVGSASRMRDWTGGGQTAAFVLSAAAAIAAVVFAARVLAGRASSSDTSD